MQTAAAPGASQCVISGALVVLVGVFELDGLYGQMRASGASMAMAKVFSKNDIMSFIQTRGRVYISAILATNDFPPFPARHRRVFTSHHFIRDDRKLVQCPEGQEP